MGTNLHLLPRSLLLHPSTADKPSFLYCNNPRVEKQKIWFSKPTNLSKGHSGLCCIHDVVGSSLYFFYDLETQDKSTHYVDLPGVPIFVRHNRPRTLLLFSECYKAVFKEDEMEEYWREF